jgi:ubiquinol-cytochrome c reductase cytochrome b subunit
MKALLDWLDHRTGYRRLLHEAFAENVPGGARWRYVWGSTLTFTLLLQAITGIFLWMAYSPNAQGAWESVFYIQHELWGGWFVRGLHHYTAQAMNVLLVVHLLQVVIDKAYLPPREVNFWFGLALLALVLALSLTGYLLPWDQKGYWATKVANNLVAITPVIGEPLQRLIVGGPTEGHLTLTRFFALHAGVIPALIAVLVVGHIYLFRRHGLTPKLPPKGPDTTFWPDQVLLDKLACLAVLAVIVALTVINRGAGLSAPADPSEPYAAARPEWYFLFLFQFLKYFPGGTEVWGAIVIPGLAFVFLLAMPLIGRTAWGHRLNLAVLWGLIAGAALLTVLSLREDRRNPEFLAATAATERDARRAVELAQSPRGIPREGAVELLRNDPLTQGPKLFAQHCASCHRHGGPDGLGGPPRDPQTAPDLQGFASREWLTELLDAQHFTSAKFFGGTKFADGKMARFLKRDVAAFEPAEREALRLAILALSAEAALPGQRDADRRDADAIARGREHLKSATLRCTECHTYHGAGEDPTGPDLTGYGSREWLVRFISNPAHERFYGRRNDRMPAYLDDGVLDERAIGLMADWLRGDWYAAPEPAGH